MMTSCAAELPGSKLMDLKKLNLKCVAWLQMFTNLINL